MAEPESPDSEIGPELVQTAVRIAQAKSWIRYSGWAILLAAIAQLPVLLLPLMLLAVDPKKALTVGLILAVGPIISLTAAIGLIRRRVWAFYLIYALLFLSFWTVTPAQGAPTLLPFIKKIIGVKPELAIFIHLTNLLFAGFLAVVHVRYFHPPTGPVPRRRLAQALVVLFILAGSVTVWRLQYRKVDAQVASVSAVPAAHEVFEILQPGGPIEIYYFNAVHIQNGGTLIASGESKEDNLRALAEEHELTEVPESNHGKLLGFIATFKLDLNRFPSEFGADDLHYTGRLKTNQKPPIQICYRRSDGTFTLQIIGMKQPE